VVYVLLGLAALALLESSLRSGLRGAGGPGGAPMLIAVAAVLPLPLAARYPLLGWRIGWLAIMLTPLAANVRTWPGGSPWPPLQLPVLFVVFCAAAVRYQRPVLWWMWALTLTPWWLWLLAWKASADLAENALATVAFTAAAIAADSLGSRWRVQRALADQTELAEQERARRAALEARARIARELHDVVAHHMSLIAVRAETAPYRLSGLPEPVGAEFGALSAAARAALADMRRMLGVFRDEQPTELAPQPRLSDLPTLIDAARQAGVQVDLSLPTALDQVPVSVGLCAYRIVQESLSNAGRHAPGAEVAVSVDHDVGSITLRVANGPGRTARPGGNGHRPGHGLAGMRERVALLGGSLSAVPAPGGGFVVCAVLPLAENA
jgi:signal transduction histidine kinase